MKPGEFLDDLKQLAGNILQDPAASDAAAALASAVLELDAWLHSGGYWPERWSGRGVNLDLGELGPQVLIEVDKIRGLLDGRRIILPSATPQLIIATPLVKDDGRCVAGLATHAVFDPDPAAATRKLYDMLREAISKVNTELG